MSIGIEKRGLLTLPVNVDKMLAKLFEQRGRHELIVDEDPVSTRPRYLSPDNDLVISFDARIGQEPPYFAACSKQPLYLSGISPVFDQIIRDPFAGQSAKRIHDDRLARTGLARKQVKARTKFDLKRIDQCNVSDLEKIEH